MKRLLMIAVTLLLSTIPAVAAEFSINGKVLEKGTRTPMRGVLVSVQDLA